MHMFRFVFTESDIDRDTPAVFAPAFAPGPNRLTPAAGGFSIESELYDLSTPSVCTSKS